MPGYIDTSGYGGGPNVSAFAAFPDITPELLRPQPQDLFGQPEYRFWFLTRNNTPIFGVEQTAGLGWTRHTSHNIDLMGMYTESRRDLTITALKLLRRIENILVPGSTTGPNSLRGSAGATRSPPSHTPGPRRVEFRPDGHCHAQPNR